MSYKATSLLKRMSISRSRRSHLVRSMIIIIIIIVLIVIFSTDKGSKWLAGISFISAAVVVALQSFVASLVAYLYIRISQMFDIGDIIKTSGSNISANGQVTKIGLFFTGIKEIDSDMMFTGTSIEFPNHLIFNGGLFNHTKKNHLFRRESKFIIIPKHDSVEKDFEDFCAIITKTYDQMLKDPIYHSPAESNIFHTKPRYELTITEKGIQCKVRLLVHFHKLIHTSNMIHITLIDAHKANKITLLYPPQNII